MIRTPVISNGWHTSIAISTVVADGLETLIGCDLFDQIGFAVTQSPSQQGKQIINISPHRAFKEKKVLQFPDLTSRKGKLKNRAKKSKLHKDFQPRHQKGRGIPIYLHDKVNTKFKKMLDEKHNAKLTNCPDKYFSSPIVVYFKKDQSKKLALD